MTTDTCDKKMPPLAYDYDEERDVITIEGLHYAGDLFREFGRAMPLETPLKITERTADGVLCLTQIEPGDVDWRNGVKDPEAGQLIQSPMLGEVRMATEEQRALIADLASAVPLSVFQELNKVLNVRGFLLTIQRVEDVMPVMGMSMPERTKLQ
jgi:hypothetical protein